MRRQVLVVLGSNYRLLPNDDYMNARASVQQSMQLHFLCLGGGRGVGDDAVAAAPSNTHKLKEKGEL